MNYKDNLEAAAWKNSEYTADGDILHDEGKYMGFIDGAKWQKQQMLKEAVEGEISSDGAGRLYAETSLYLEDEMALNEGDKVKIIIVPDKEDKK